MFVLEQLWPGALLAALVAGLGLALGTAFLRGRHRWLAAAVLAAGYASGHLFVAGIPRFPPNEAPVWMFYFALLALLIGAWDGLGVGRSGPLMPDRRAGSRLALGLLLAAGLFRLLLSSFFRKGGWTLGEGWFWLASLAAGAVAFWWMLETLGARGWRFFSLPLVGSIVAGGTGAALLLSGSMLLGLVAMVLSAAAGALAVVGWLAPGLRFDRGTAVVFAMLLPALWASGYFFADLPAASVALLAAGPLAWRLMPGPAVLGSAKSFAGRLILTGSCAAAAVYVALRASPPLDY